MTRGAGSSCLHLTALSYGLLHPSIWYFSIVELPYSNP